MASRWKKEGENGRGWEENGHHKHRGRYQLGSSPSSDGLRRKNGGNRETLSKSGGGGARIAVARLRGRANPLGVRIRHITRGGGLLNEGVFTLSKED